jgi:hypothetical protein
MKISRTSFIVRAILVLAETVITFLAFLVFSLPFALLGSLEPISEGGLTVSQILSAYLYFLGLSLLWNLLFVFPLSIILQRKYWKQALIGVPVLIFVLYGIVTYLVMPFLIIFLLTVLFAVGQSIANKLLMHVVQMFFRSKNKKRD